MQQLRLKLKQLPLYCSSSSHYQLSEMDGFSKFAIQLLCNQAIVVMVLVVVVAVVVVFGAESDQSCCFVVVAIFVA